MRKDENRIIALVLTNVISILFFSFSVARVVLGFETSTHKTAAIIGGALSLALIVISVVSLWVAFKSRKPM